MLLAVYWSFVYRYPAVHSVRKHEGVANTQFKLLRFYGQDVPHGEEWELYNLEQDPEGLNNVYGQSEYAGTVMNMKQELQRLRQQYKVPASDG